MLQMLHALTATRSQLLLHTLMYVCMYVCICVCMHACIHIIQLLVLSSFYVLVRQLLYIFFFCTCSGAAGHALTATVYTQVVTICLALLAADMLY